MKKHLLTIPALCVATILPLTFPTVAHAADSPKKTSASPTTSGPVARDISVTLKEFKNSATGTGVTVLTVPEYAVAAFYREVNALARSHDVVLTDGFHAYPEKAVADVDSSDDGSGTWVRRESRFRSGLRMNPGKNGRITLEEREAQFTPGDVECSAVHLGDHAKDDSPRDAEIAVEIEGRLAVLGVNRVLVLRARDKDAGLEKKLGELGFAGTGEKTLCAIAEPDVSRDTYYSLNPPLIYSFRNSPGRTTFSGPLHCFTVDNAPAFSASDGLWGLLFVSEGNRTGFESSILLGTVWSNRENRLSRSQESRAFLGFWRSANSPEKVVHSLGYGLLAASETRLNTAGATESSAWSILAPFGNRNPLLYSYETDTHTYRTTHRFLIFFSLDI